MQWSLVAASIIGWQISRHKISFGESSQHYLLSSLDKKTELEPESDQTSSSYYGLWKTQKIHETYEMIPWEYYAQNIDSGDRLTLVFQQINYREKKGN